MSEFTFEPIEFQAEGGRRPAALYRPKSDVPVRGLLLAPGGLALGETEAYAWAGERLAAAGWACLVLTYGAPSPYGNAADVIAALHHLQQVPGVSRDRIGLIGHSRGAMAALAAAAAEPGIRAVVSIAAPADLSAYMQGLAGFFPAARGVLVQFMTGEPDAIPDLYQSVSPLALAARIRQPILLVHGTADMRVPFHHAQQLESALRAAGNLDVQLQLIPDMGHYFELGTMGYQFDRVVNLAVEWLDHRL
jgi:dipeptidyl aminopeptidase/acylaminoacyl peptidase